MQNCIKCHDRKLNRMKSVFNVVLFAILTGVFLFSPFRSVFSQTEKTPNQILFTTEVHEPLKIYISCHLRKLKRDVGKNRKYHEATFSYLYQGDSVGLDIKVRTRGHFRRDPANCNFPPIKLNFSDDNTQNTLFEGQDKIKMVTPCQKNRDRFEQFVMQEFLIYKMYNLLTEYSFRVRLAEFTFIDTQGKYDTYTIKGYMIEDNDKLAGRCGGKIIEFENIPQDGTNFEQMTMIAIFQYLIGNTDWSVSALHNMELLSPGDYKPPIAIPYDFDWTGLVNAPYAKPAEHLNISSVRQRLYRGYHRSYEQLKPVIDLFNQKKDEIYSLYRNFPYLEQKNKERSLEYIDEFYEIINDKSLVEKIFIEGCRTDR